MEEVEETKRDKMIKSLVLISFLVVIIAVFTFGEMKVRNDLDYFDYPSESDLPIYAIEIS